MTARVYANITHRNTTSLLSYLPREITFQERIIYNSFPYELQRQVITLPTYSFRRHVEGQDVTAIEQPTFVIPLSSGVYILDYSERPCENISKMTIHYYYRVPFEEIYPSISNERRFTINKRQAPTSLLYDEVELFMMCALRCDPRLLSLQTFVNVRMKRIIFGSYNEILVEARNVVDDPPIYVTIRRDNFGNLSHVIVTGENISKLLVGEMYPKERTPLLT